MSTFEIGDRVYIDCIDGFGGPATIIDHRDIEHAHWKVRMDDDNPPPFWAHDFEVKPLEGWGKDSHDSRIETRKHIGQVQALLTRVIDDLARRRADHDKSKFLSPEVEAFDEYTPKLAATTYGSDEYRSYLAAMKPALDHHYAANSHHPEHYPDGIRGMSLLDVIEMLCDWKAATLRHNDGDIRRSIEVGQKRFGYGDELKAILLNTLPLFDQGAST